MFQKIKQLIGKSLVDHLGKTSSARISSYFILAQILLTSLVLLVIDIINAFIKWSIGETFSISTEHIIVFGMILTHHLFLLGVKKSTEETPFPSLDNKKSEKQQIVYEEDVDVYSEKEHAEKTIK
jgi:hypothetical protein